MRRRSAGAVAAMAALGGVVAVLLVVLVASGSHHRPTSRAPEPRHPSPEVVLGGAPRSGFARAGAREAGQRFLRGYVAFLYGRRRDDELQGASADLRRSLRRARLRVPPARAARTPRIIALRAVLQAPGVAQVTATVGDGDLAAYPVTAIVERRGARWLVTHVAGD
jgi:hypothetical protein